MWTKCIAIGAGLLLAGLLAATPSFGFDCPNTTLEDQSLIYMSEQGGVPFRGERKTDAVPLDRKISFLYVLDKRQHAPEAGAILVKRIYDIPDDWRDTEDSITMRRNKEKEIKNFPADIYESYHEDVSLSTSELRFAFHAKYAASARTDDSAEKRGAFLYPGSVLKEKRKLAKPLILTWTGFGLGNFACLDFNLNEGEGDYKKIEIFIYEIEPREGAAPPHRTVHLTIVPRSQ